MGTNFYLVVEPQRIVSEDYLANKEAIVSVLVEYGIDFSSEEATQEFLQRTLDALGVNDVSVFGGYSEQGEHLGKRSAAGQYCYGCDISLVTGEPGGIDVEGIHTGEGKYLDACPKCGCKNTNKEFYLPELFRPTPEETVQEGQSAVRYAHSFSYAKSPEEIEAYPSDTPIVTEYGERMTMAEFRREVIGKAKFLLTKSVGVEFS